MTHSSLHVTPLNNANVVPVTYKTLRSLQHVQKQKRRTGRHDTKLKISYESLTSHTSHVTFPQFLYQPSSFQQQNE